jgi:hypothetical protein
MIIVPAFRRAILLPTGPWLIGALAVHVFANRHSSVLSDPWPAYTSILAAVFSLSLAGPCMKVKDYLCSSMIYTEVFPEINLLALRHFGS